MNFQTLHKQRKFVLLSAVLGLISVFLPWKTVSAGLFGASMSEGINGFHGAGILTFLLFIVAGIVAFLGNQTAALDKGSWMAVMAAGAVALIGVIINISTTSGNSMGFVELSVGLGCWIALVAAIGVVGSAWLFRNPGDNLKEGFENLKKNISSLNVPAAGSGTPPKPDSNNKVAELERLIRLKDAGHITEEEYQQMKSKIL